MVQSHSRGQIAQFGVEAQLTQMGNRAGSRIDLGRDGRVLHRGCRGLRRAVLWPLEPALIV